MNPHHLLSAWESHAKSLQECRDWEPGFCRALVECISSVWEEDVHGEASCIRCGGRPGTTNSLRCAVCLTAEDGRSPGPDHGGKVVVIWLSRGQAESEVHRNTEARAGTVCE